MNEWSRTHYTHGEALLSESPAGFRTSPRHSDRLRLPRLVDRSGIRQTPKHSSWPEEAKSVDGLFRLKSLYPSPQ